MFFFNIFYRGRKLSVSVIFSIFLRSSYWVKRFFIIRYFMFPLPFLSKFWKSFLINSKDQVFPLFLRQFFLTIFCYYYISFSEPTTFIYLSKLASQKESNCNDMIRDQVMKRDTYIYHIYILSHYYGTVLLYSMQLIKNQCLWPYNTRILRPTRLKSIRFTSLLSLLTVIFFDLLIF